MNDISLMEKATSSEFLQTRIALNKNALNNFEHWSINTMPKIPMKSNILDIGCGTGKQLLSFSSFLQKSVLIMVVIFQKRVYFLLKIIINLIQN